MLLHERGELLFSRDTNLAVFDIKLLQVGQLRKSRDAAAYLTLVQVKLPKLREVLKRWHALIMMEANTGLPLTPVLMEQAIELESQGRRLEAESEGWGRIALGGTL